VFDVRVCADRADGRSLPYSAAVYGGHFRVRARQNHWCRKEPRLSYCLPKSTPLKGHFAAPALSLTRRQTEERSCGIRPTPGWMNIQTRLDAQSRRRTVLDLLEARSYAAPISIIVMRWSNGPPLQHSGFIANLLTTFSRKLERLTVFAGVGDGRDEPGGRLGDSCS